MNLVEQFDRTIDASRRAVVIQTCREALDFLDAGSDEAPDAQVRLLRTYLQLRIVYEREAAA